MEIIGFESHDTSLSIQVSSYDKFDKLGLQNFVLLIFTYTFHFFS